MLMNSLVSEEEFILPRELPAPCLEGAVLLQNRYKLIERMRKGGAIAEVGTQRGDFAKFILEVSSPAELHLFDISFRQKSHPFDHVFFRRYVDEGRVFLHEGDSSSQLGLLPDHYFDWIYIDGDHSFEGVMKDIAQALRKIRPDGCLVFNDYTIYSPVELMQYGVQRAVNETIISEGFRVVYFALSVAGYHDVCIQRMSDRTP